MSGDVARPVDGYGPLWIWVLKVLLLLPPAGALLLAATVWSMHDHYEIQCWPHMQLYLGADHLREEMLESGGRFRDGTEAVRALAAQEDPWGRAFRFELLDDDGRHARVFSLGHDGRPGGEGCDADLVWWIDAHGALSSWDVGAPPEAWVESGWGG